MALHKLHNYLIEHGTQDETHQATFDACSIQNSLQEQPCKRYLLTFKHYHKNTINEMMAQIGQKKAFEIISRPNSREQEYRTQQLMFSGLAFVSMPGTRSQIMAMPILKS
jgi:hypothetical protein